MSENQIQQPYDANKSSSPKPPKRALIAAGVVFLVIASFVAGANSARSVDFESLGLRVLNQNPPESDITTVDYGLLWQTLKVINRDYVDRPLDQQKLMYGAIEGMVRALDDPHSNFLTPEQNAEFRSDLNGDFEGIGAEISTRDGALIVVAPLPGSPAERAGLRPQDAILEIDGEEAVDISVDEAVNKIRGPKGSTVKLTVKNKDSDEPREISITREKIHVNSVETKIQELDGQRIGVITLSRFGPDTKKEFVEGVSRLQAQGAKGVVLDLRNNPGGLLDASIDVSSYWLKGDQAVLKEVGADKRELVYYSKGPGSLSGMPTVVLLNQGSASASEIVAGALKDNNKATVVGEKSFGKGSVQDLIDLGGGSAVKITIAKWLTPSGRSIHNQGVEPDITVEKSEEDFTEDRDPQMDKALEVLKEKI